MAGRSRRAKSDDQIYMSDPQAIKALAHPARMAVMDALHGDNSLTATEAAAIAGLSPSAMSYHLRAMAKWGVLVQAQPEGDGRERRWRLAARGWTIEGNDPAAAGATAIIAANAIDRTRAAAVDWIGRRSLEEPEAWQELMAVMHSQVWLTEEEARAVADDIEAVFDRVKKRRTRVPGSRRVRLGFVLVPVD